MIKCQRCRSTFKNSKGFEEHPCLDKIENKPPVNDAEIKSQLIINFDDDEGASKFVRFLEMIGANDFEDLLYDEFGQESSINFNISTDLFYGISTKKGRKENKNIILNCSIITEENDE
jgi:hypothetical protein